jgi:predicted phosphate transport protein (TIGR00153 family)
MRYAEELKRYSNRVQLRSVSIMVLDNDRYLKSELSNITQMLEEHFRVALSASKMVNNAVNDWLSGNTNITPEDLKAITGLEEKGDDLKRTILLQLAKANTLMQREDLLRLVHYNDKLADGAEWCMYHLAAITGSWNPEGALKEKIAKMSELVMEEITQQREAVRFLSINMEEAIKRAEEICRLEKQVDVVQREIVTLLYPANVPLSILLRFRDFTNMMEDIANFGEDAAITIRTLSLTLNM